jgi:hypothetical protein
MLTAHPDLFMNPFENLQTSEGNTNFHGMKIVNQLVVSLTNPSICSDWYIWKEIGGAENICWYFWKEIWVAENICWYFWKEIEVAENICWYFWKEIGVAENICWYFWKEIGVAKVREFTVGDIIR